MRGGLSAGLAMTILLSCAQVLGAQERAGAEPMRLPVAPGADGNDWEAHFDRGAQLFRSAPGEASAYFYWASRIDPSRAEPLFARWANHLYRAKNEDVYSYLRDDEALWRQPEFVKAYGLRTRALMRNPFVHRGLEVVVYDRLPGEFSDTRDTRAWIAYTEGKFPQAVALFTRTVDRGGPRAFWSRYDRALAHVASGNMAAALADLQAIVEELRRRDDQQVGFYVSKHHLLYSVALVQNQMGDRPASRASFGEATVEDASFGYGWAGLAALSTAARQHAQAVSEYEQALQLEPDDGYLHFLQANALFALQRFEGAAAALQRAVELEPHYAAPHYLLGRVRERQGKEAEAYPHYERFVRLASAKDPQAKSIRLRLELRARADTAKKAPPEGPSR